MSKKKKVIIIITTVIVLVFTAAVGLYAAGNIYYSSQRIYEENWNIELPDDIKEKFDANNQGWFGDGVRYTIYETKEQSAYFNDFESKKNSEIEETFKEVFSELNLSNSEYPDWEHDYVWKQLNRYENRLYMVFDKETNTLFVAQLTQ